MPRFFISYRRSSPFQKINFIQVCQWSENLRFYFSWFFFKSLNFSYYNDGIFTYEAGIGMTIDDPIFWFLKHEVERVLKEATLGKSSGYRFSVDQGEHVLRWNTQGIKNKRTSETNKKEFLDSLDESKTKMREMKFWRIFCFHHIVCFE